MQYCMANTNSQIMLHLLSICIFMYCTRSMLSCLSELCCVVFHRIAHTTVFTEVPVDVVKMSCHMGWCGLCDA